MRRAPAKADEINRFQFPIELRVEIRIDVMGSWEGIVLR